MPTYEIRTRSGHIKNVKVLAVLPEDAVVDWVWTQPDGETVTDLESAVAWLDDHDFDLHELRS